MRSSPSSLFGDGIPLRTDLHRNLNVAHGAHAVDTWLSALPAIVERWCETWKLRISTEFPSSAYNVMFYGESNLAGSVVLKLNLPSPEVLSEIEALTQTSGHGTVRLIDADPNVAIMMLERVAPGTPLRSANLSDREATLVGVDAMDRFWRKPVRPDNLFSLRAWMSSLFEYPARPTYPDGPIPAAMIDRAMATAERLLRTQTDLVLLHGDIHHDNILRGGDQGWVTIDPKGLIGERGFDTGTWMHNPPGFGLKADLDARLRNRVAVFARELGLDPCRTAQWSFVFLVLSMCWTTESEGYDVEKLVSSMNCVVEMERIMDDVRA